MFSILYSVFITNRQQPIYGEVRYIKLVRILDETIHYPVKKMCKPSEKARDLPKS